MEILSVVMILIIVSSSQNYLTKMGSQKMLVVFLSKDFFVKFSENVLAGIDMNVSRILQISNMTSC